MRSLTLNQKFLENYFLGNCKKVMQPYINMKEDKTILKTKKYHE